jgi:hypothetical protein
MGPQPLTPECFHDMCEACFSDSCGCICHLFELLAEEENFGLVADDDDPAAAGESKP